MSRILVDKRQLWVATMNGGFFVLDVRHSVIDKILSETE